MRSMLMLAMQAIQANIDMHTIACSFMKPKPQTDLVTALKGGIAVTTSKSSI